MEGDIEVSLRNLVKKIYEDLSHFGFDGSFPYYTGNAEPEIKDLARDIEKAIRKEKNNG